MSSVFPVEQIMKGTKLADWHPTGGNGVQHRTQEQDELKLDKGGIDGEIIAALQNHGPSSPAELARRCGVERLDISKAVHALLEAKKVKAQGAMMNRMIALPGQSFPTAAPAPTKKGKPGPKPKKAARAPVPAAARTPPPASDLGITINDAGELGLQRGDLRLVLDHPGDVARLREPRALNGVIPLSAELGPMLGDALELADDTARSVIELECRDLDVGGVRYYDLATADPEIVDMEQPLRYLTARGLVVYLPDLHGGRRLARFVEAAA